MDTECRNVSEFYDALGDACSNQRKAECASALTQALAQYKSETVCCSMCFHCHGVHDFGAQQRPLLAVLHNRDIQEATRLHHKLQQDFVGPLVEQTVASPRERAIQEVRYRHEEILTTQRNQHSGIDKGRP